LEEESRSLALIESLTKSTKLLTPSEDHYYDEEEQRLYEVARPEVPHEDELEARFEWQIGELLGSGAFGQVYSALNFSNGQLMALKRIPIGAEMLSDSETPHPKMMALEKEIHLLASMENPHIVEYLGMEIEQDALHIVREMGVGGGCGCLLCVVCW
jgi:serine/threonine protein kinase